MSQEICYHTFLIKTYSFEICSREAWGMLMFSSSPQQGSCRKKQFLNWNIRKRIICESERSFELFMLERNEQSLRGDDIKEIQFWLMVWWAFWFPTQTSQPKLDIDCLLHGLTQNWNVYRWLWLNHSNSDSSVNNSSQLRIFHYSPLDLNVC